MLLHESDSSRWLRGALGLSLRGASLTTALAGNLERGEFRVTDVGRIGDERAQRSLVDLEQFSDQTVVTATLDLGALSDNLALAVTAASVVERWLSSVGLERISSIVLASSSRTVHPAVVGDLCTLLLDSGLVDTVGVNHDSVWHYESITKHLHDGYPLAYSWLDYGIDHPEAATDGRLDQCLRDGLAPVVTYPTESPLDIVKLLYVLSHSAGITLCVPSDRADEAWQLVSTAGADERQLLESSMAEA